MTAIGSIRQLGDSVLFTGDMARMRPTCRLVAPHSDQPWRHGALIFRRQNGNELKIHADIQAVLGLRAQCARSQPVRSSDSGHAARFSVLRTWHDAMRVRWIILATRHMNSSTSQPSLPTRVERFDTIVIGGGQAGLAVGHHLAARDIDFTILSDEACVGDNWRKRWDSLRLFTPARYSGLPGMPFPAPPDHCADKDEVADYLEHYAARFDLPIRLRTRVRSLAHDGVRFVMRTETSDALLEASAVIVATGAFHAPNIPVVACRLSPAIHQIHSSEYRTPFELPQGPVLVVGAGNSGAQIALEVAEHRKVWLAGRDTGHLPRRFLGRDVFHWLWPIMYFANADTRLGQRLRRGMRSGGDALIGIPERTLVNGGIVRVQRLEKERAGLPVCGDKVLEPSTIIWCTGFRPDFSWIDLPVFDDNGYPRHRRGAAVDVPGLYFAGLRFQHRLRSQLIGGAGEDASFVADQVARRTQAYTD